MKNQKRMNVNKSILVIFILHSILTFSQNKKDVYFILENNNINYKLSTSNGDIKHEGKLTDFNNFYLLFRTEYENREKKIKKEKRDSVFHDIVSYENYPKLPSLDFRIKSRIKTQITHCQMHFLNIVDFNWLKNNSWIQPKQKEISFKNIYFLYKIDNDNYIKYKVERILLIQ